MSVRGGMVRPRVSGDILVTLCRFDSKPLVEAKTGPFIPCERRLAVMEIWEIQGHDFWTSF